MAKRGRPRHPDVLTPREWEVLALLREGRSNEEIAERLRISLAGAKYHVSEILGKLGVASREEAALWSASGGSEHPWWAVAVATLGALRRAVSASRLSALVAAAAVLVVAGGIGLLVWGLVRTDGGGDSAAISRPPIPTPQPYVAEAVDCPGSFSTPEDAIGACRARLFRPNPNFTFNYEGDCDTPADGELSRDFECSTWKEGADSPRAYLLNTVCADCFDWLIVQRSDAGWGVTQRAPCQAQDMANINSELWSQGLSTAPVRSDDCSYPPPPFPRPSLRLGQAGTEQTEAAGVWLEIAGGTASSKLLYPGRGILLYVRLRNVSGAELAWETPDIENVALVAEDGRRFAAFEAGGALAMSSTTSIPASATWHGWFVFPTEELGSYTLVFPGFPDLPVDLVVQPDVVRP